MPELTDLLAVFGAVDQVVARNPQLGPEVAELLPPYGRGAAGWYDRLVGEPGPRRLSFVPPDVPSLEQALRNMSAEDAPRLTNRSLLGVAAYRRVRNAAGASLSDTDPLFVGDDVLAAALAPVLPSSVASGFASTYSTRLVELLGDPYVHRTLGSFDAVLAEAYRQELVTSFVARQMPVPMMWTVLPATAGGGPALVFEVRLRVHGSVAGKRAARDHCCEERPRSRLLDAPPTTMVHHGLDALSGRRRAAIPRDSGMGVRRADG